MTPTGHNWKGTAMSELNVVATIPIKAEHVEAMRGR